MTISINKTLIASATVLLMSTPVALAQSGTTLGGGGNTRANGGGQGGASGMTGGEAGGMKGGAMKDGATQNDPGSPASSAAKGNDPTGSHGATNNRY